MSRLSRYVGLTAAGVVVAAAGLGAGYGLGHSNRETVTTTVVSVKVRTRTRTRTVVKVKTVRVQPTITRTATVTRTTVVTEPPTAQGVYVDYGDYGGIVQLVGLQWYLDDPAVGGGHIDGQAEYLGGLNCQSLSYLEVTGSVIDETGTIQETLLGNLSSVPQGSRVPISIQYQSNVTRGRIELFVSAAQCP